MTAFEEFKYDDDNHVIAVLPASPQQVFADQVLRFSEALMQERKRFEGVEPEDEWDSGYFSGYERAVKILIDQYSEIFNVKFEVSE